MKVANPLCPKLNEAEITTVLRGLASQEGCDGEPYDQMTAAADYITALQARVAELEAERQSLAEARALEDYAHVNGDAGNISRETVSDMLAKAARIRAED